MDVGIIGGSGYGGAELLRLLADHPTFKVQVIAGGRTAGSTVGEVFPQLAATAYADRTISEVSTDGLADCQIVFAATPHGVSLQVLPPLVGRGRVVVDLSGAFRLPAATFESSYGMTHAAGALTPAVYGLPELWRDEIAGAELIAGPGCYPTAALLALAPLTTVAGGGPITVTGMSGWSGAGRGLRDDLHASHAHANVGAYGAPQHRHAPEIAMQLGRLDGAAPALSFVPHLVPMTRGMVVTCSVPLADGVEPGDVTAAVATRYRDEPFVWNLDRSWPQSTHVLGANTAQLAVAVDSVAGVAIASCALDNLVKGAAGQAIQAANVAVGVPETAGLPTAGLYP